MTASRNAKARAQWVARATEEERKGLERRRRLLSGLYDEMDRYLASVGRLRPMLQEIATELGVGRADLKRLFDVTDREVAALYEPRKAPAAPANEEPADEPENMASVAPDPASPPWGVPDIIPHSGVYAQAMA